MRCLLKATGLAVDGVGAVNEVVCGLIGMVMAGETIQRAFAWVIKRLIWLYLL